ncbi:MAG: anti-sigma factor [Bacillota bacterium]|nr:anti-sigma factor [Bacillota bacterium]
MKCVQCMERLSEYLDRELSSVEQQQVETHLEECSDCRNLMNDINALREAVKFNIESIPAPPDLVDKILLSIQKEKQKNAKSQWIASVLLIFIISPVFLLFTRAFSSIFYLFYTTGIAFWRSFVTLMTVVSPSIMLSVGILALTGISLGFFAIRKLIHDFEMNGVFQ